MEEILGWVQCWLIDDAPRAQIMSQNAAEERFDWYIKQAREAGAEVSSVKRIMRPIKDEDGHAWMMQYQQRVKIVATEEIVQQLKERFKRRSSWVY